MKAVGFFYSWSGRRQLDPYFGAFARAFADLGIDLRIVLANEMLDPSAGMRSLHPLVDESKLIAFVRAEGPDFLFSVNNAGMTARLQREAGVPVVKWLVDDVPHLFSHDGRAPMSGDGEDGQTLICYSSTLLEQIEARFEGAAGKAFWVSHGTDLAGRPFEAAPASYPISFVGSCLDYRPILRVLQAARPRGAAHQVLAALAAVRTDYVRGCVELGPGPELGRALADIGVGAAEFERHVADAVTTQNRMEGLRRVADLGLHLFGNDLWLDSLSCTTELAERFEFDNRIDSYEKLLGVYARSRISVNIPNVQNCAGLAARVFDIMASPSLLITEHHPGSDLYALFGEDCPVPMYRDFDHLRELCAYYLANEAERLRVVERCNALVGERFLLRNRLGEMLRLAGISAPASRPAEPPSIVRRRAFHGVPRRVDRLGPAARLVARKVGTKALSPLGRWLGPR
ncbi:MAG TPA: glycosyltransferase [Allosphingosinicella sp.]|jgi:hypothetical protein